MPYLRRIQTQRTVRPNWLIQSETLLLKSRLEFETARLADRGSATVGKKETEFIHRIVTGVLQLQVLYDQFDDESPGVAERMQCYFLLAYPTR